VPNLFFFFVLFDDDDVGERGGGLALLGLLLGVCLGGCFDVEDSAWHDDATATITTTTTTTTVNAHDLDDDCRRCLCLWPMVGTVIVVATRSLLSGNYLFYYDGDGRDRDREGYGHVWHGPSHGSWLAGFCLLLFVLGFGWMGTSTALPRGLDTSPSTDRRRVHRPSVDRRPPPLHSPPPQPPHTAQTQLGQ